MKKFHKILLSFVVLVIFSAITIYALDIYYDRQHRVIITTQVPLYSEPYGYVRDEGLIGYVGPTGELKVERVTYTKDYRMVKISTDDGREGWVISGSEGVKFYEKE